MERVQGEEMTVEVFENKIDFYLSQFCTEQKIDNMRTAPQSVWNGALRYIYNHVFKNNKDVLKQKNKTVVEGSLMPSTFNAYDYDMLLEIADYYIFNMCMVNNKEVSILGFSALTGIEESMIHEWGNRGEYTVSSQSSQIYKKLRFYREESLSNKLADGKQNPVGVIAMLNRHYGWASPYTADANRGKTTLTAAELPKLGTDAGGIRQIAQSEIIDE